jgi:hypothetical protein
MTKLISLLGLLLLATPALAQEQALTEDAAGPGLNVWHSFDGVNVS